uniref:ORF5a protein n=1 Tax=Free State vervet virus TaxID=1737586 RepID=A0A161CYJ3_9NIDO|nr:ORF5a protein [Free State vervet virus]
MFSELGLLVDLWLYHVVCISALLCLCYAAHYACVRKHQQRIAFRESLRVHACSYEDTHI